MQTLDCDFLAISGHKMCVPSGIGALWGRAELLQKMEPCLLGGHMINSVRVDKTTWGELPHKFEAGTSPMAEAVGFAAAIDYLQAIGFDAIEEHEHELTAYALDRLAERVYDELHLMARRYMKNERDANTLQGTALVHEVYLRLVDVNHLGWRGRAQLSQRAREPLSARRRRRIARR